MAIYVPVCVKLCSRDIKGREGLRLRIDGDISDAELLPIESSKAKARRA